jgi:hypothetical protein
MTDQIVGWLEELKAEYGSWQAVGRQARTSDRWMRAIRKKSYKAISMTSLDKILTRCESNHRVEDLEWYTVEGMLEIGVWEPMVDWRTYYVWLQGEREMGRMLK